MYFQIHIAPECVEKIFIFFRVFYTIFLLYKNKKENFYFLVTFFEYFQCADENHYISILMQTNDF